MNSWGDSFWKDNDSYKNVYIVNNRMIDENK